MMGQFNFFSLQLSKARDCTKSNSSCWVIFFSFSFLPLPLDFAYNVGLVVLPFDLPTILRALYFPAGRSIFRVGSKSVMGICSPRQQ